MKAEMWTRILLCGAAALACAAGQDDVKLPEGVRAVWDIGKAYREVTPTRERISVNGLWRWQPAADATDAVPAGGWGYLRVPESWNGSQVFYPRADWDKRKIGAVNSAWYQREITVPREWAGRRITLYAEYLNSYAVVYVDGARAGELRYPAGELDLTSVCRPGKTHVLSMMVVAMPLKAVMLSYSDSANAKNVEGKVARKGLCGDVYLTSSPARAQITDVRVETSVRKWQITLDAAMGALDGEARYAVRGRILDGDKVVKEFTSKPFKGSEAASGRMRFTEAWHAEKLWDTHTPKNQYTASVSLIDAGGKTLDTALPIRFGFREFWINGRDFYLNGTRIYLSAIPLDNGQGGPVMASYEATKATIERYKTFGINFVYTHNYGCEPGAHNQFDEVLRAADDTGMLLSFSQPHFGHYDWTAPGADQNNGYAQHAEFYVRVAQNHPSVVFYSTSHNGTGYSEDMNPYMTDGIQSPRDQWSTRNAQRAQRAEAILQRLDPSHIVYHHASGNLGSMHASNFYANWVPVQEMSDWFEHWATKGVKPVFTCEYSVPFMWDWAMYRGWYKGKREFGSAVVPWEYCVAEWNAQFLGDRSYDITEEEKKNLRWEADRFRKGGGWFRWDYPQSLNSQVFDERYKVVSMYLTDNWRAFRTWGMSANSPWDYGGYWRRPAGREKELLGLPLDVDWDNLQRPGPRARYVREDQARELMAFKPSDYEPTLAAQALYRNNMPLLAYIGGKPAAFTSKDHNFLPGETVEKQLIVINNTREAVTYECAWSLALPSAVSGKAKGALPTGEQKRIPLKFALPKSLARGRYELRATVRFGNGETQEDAFAIDVMAQPPAVQAAGKVALFDPKGETARLLTGIGVRTDRVEANADLSNYDLLIVGKGALDLRGAAPDISRVRDGLKVVVFEQTGEVLEKRFGFRIAEYGLRQVFRRVPDHPLLAGVDENQLRDWRGSATILPPKLTYERPDKFNYVPTVQWAGIPVTRAWRAGNRGNVASALIEKPVRGDFMPIVDGGYSFQYSALMEYREGKGMALFCQMDVNGRTESDPAAEALARNIVRYVSAWKPAARRTAVYAGDAAGKTYLESMGVAVTSYAGGALSAGQTLVVGQGGSQSLAAHAAEIAQWVKAGGKVLAIGLDEKEANAFLPVKVSTVSQEHIAAYFAPFGAESAFAGISPAEVHNRDPRKMALVSKGASVVGDGVLASSENVVFCQMVPWQFQYNGENMNVKRTFRRVSCLASRLLGNMGVAAQSPLLARFSRPVDEKEKRWLEGLYLDQPEEWDDPYRFFRW
jgi:hypothetical protein